MMKRSIISGDVDRGGYCVNQLPLPSKSIMFSNVVRGHSMQNPLGTLTQRLRRFVLGISYSISSLSSSSQGSIRMLRMADHQARDLRSKKRLASDKNGSKERSTNAQTNGYRSLASQSNPCEECVIYESSGNCRLRVFLFLLSWAFFSKSSIFTYISFPSFFKMGVLPVIMRSLLYIFQNLSTSLSTIQSLVQSHVL